MNGHKHMTSRNCSVGLKRCLMCFSVPLALFFSCESPTPTEDARLNPRMARHLQSFEKNEITTMLLDSGLGPDDAATWATYASCASGLSPMAYRWQQSERKTGLFLIPDSLRTSCGYGHLKVWQFRAQMQDAQRNINCALRLARHGWIPHSFDQCAPPRLAENELKSRTEL